MPGSAGQRSGEFFWLLIHGNDPPKMLLISQAFSNGSQYKKKATLIGEEIGGGDWPPEKNSVRPEKF